MIYKINIFILGVLLSSASFGFTPGSYECVVEGTNVSFTYEIKSLTIDRLSIPHLEIVKTIKTKLSSDDKTFRISGFPMEQSNSLGQKSLVLAKTQVLLKEDGTPICSK